MYTKKPGLLGLLLRLVHFMSFRLPGKVENMDDSPEKALETLHQQQGYELLEKCSQMHEKLSKQVENLQNLILKDRKSLRAEMQNPPYLQKLATQIGNIINGERGSKTLQSKIDTLKSQNASLEQEKNEYEQYVRYLKHQLDMRIEENHKLHEIILGSVDEPESIFDSDIVQAFAELEHNVMTLVAKYVQPEKESSCQEYNALARPDDRRFYVRARVAFEIWKAMFSPSTRLFGLDQELDQYQLKLESTFSQFKVDDKKIVDWRVALLKASVAISNEPYPARLYKSKELSHTLDTQLREICPEVKMEDLDQVSQKALKLALTLRARRGQYAWLQGASAASLDANDIETIGPYNEKANAGHEKPAKILFGPVYKIVDGEYVLLRPGQILVGYEDE